MDGRLSARLSFCGARSRAIPGFAVSRSGVAELGLGVRVIIIRAWQGLDARQRALLAQLVRYGVVGVGVTSFQIGVYNLLLGAGHRPPLVANALASALAMLVGFTIHSRYTFVGHGGRAGVARTAARFVAANLIGVAINSLWVWSFVHALGWSPHLASLPMFFATPAVLFWLNRLWVFE